MIRKYGWKKEPRDPRDRFLKVSRVRPLFESYPEYLDLSGTCSTVEDQSIIGACILHGIVAAMEQLDFMEHYRWEELSRLFGYYILRDDPNDDSGGFIRVGIKRVAQHGICDEKLWPYDVRKFSVKPPEEAFKDALKRKDIEYYRIADDDRKIGIMDSLMQKRLVIFGFTVYHSFEVGEVNQTGLMTMPTKRDLEIGARGGHCVAIVGWKWIDKALYFKCRNSYSADWGDHGYFWMPAEYVLDTGLSDDFWVIVRVPFPKFGDEPWRPDTTAPDVKWYISVTSIVKGIVALWDRIFGSKQSDKEDSK